MFQFVQKLGLNAIEQKLTFLSATFSKNQVPKHNAAAE